ncbi:MAG: hypothetical protein OXI93_14775, partial [Bryobacterales bacterium]|nr:hypothetical protein [Bryobacterales bacterium]
MVSIPGPQISGLGSGDIIVECESFQGVNLHFSPPDGRSTRYDRQDFAFPSQRLLAVLNVL